MSRSPWRINAALARLVWWSGWPLLPVVFGFLLTGFIISGRYGLDRWLDAKTALALHKLLHGPLIVLVLVHSIPATYLAIQRWRGRRGRRPHTPEQA